VEFTYTPDQLELRDRASRLTDAIIPFEDPCEAGRGLDDESLAEIRRLTLEHQLNAINMPVEWGGQGLSVLDQVIVSERLGQLTNALWDAVWRPANALRHCTPEQRERYLIPAIAGDRRDCFAVTEE
jgi:acyl-CoA dehydrogenase